MSLQKNIGTGLYRTLELDAGFTEPEYEHLCTFLEVCHVKKKELYLQPGEICRGAAYVNKGCLRRYILDDHAKEIIINFATEDWLIGDLESFLQQNRFYAGTHYDSHWQNNFCLNRHHPYNQHHDNPHRLAR